MKQELLHKQKLPDGWKWSTLGEECIINPRRPKEMLYPEDSPTTFVPMDVVDQEKGRLDIPKTVPFSKVKKGYTYFEENDVLFAKITPCMQNKKSCIAKNLLNGFGFGSTEFHVFRCKSNVIPEWIYHFVRTSRFLQEAENNFTGAVGQQRVPTTFLESYPLLVPPASIQKQIVSKLDQQMAQIDIMKKEANSKLESAKIFYKSYLEKKFKEEANKGTEQLQKTITFMVSGISRPFQDKDLGIPVLRSNNVSWGEVNFEDLRYWYNPDDRGTSYEDIILQSGDVLVNFVNGSSKELGKTAVFYGYKRDVIITTNFWRVVFDNKKLIPEYFQLFSMTEDYIRQISKKGKFQGPGSFNQTDFKTVEIPLPSVERQKEIIAFAEKIRLETKKLLQESERCSDALDILPSAILNEIFGKYSIEENGN